MKSNTSTKGFTIVELLIVIVVIAILAAISIVAYNGIQQRARNAQVTAGASAYNKALESYKVVSGSYPTDVGCLGANYPGDICWKQTGSSVINVNSTLDSKLSEYMPNKPTLATKLIDLGLTSDPAYYQRAGLAYNVNNTANNMQVRYYLDGLNQSCVGGFSPVNEGSTTYCFRIFSN